MKWILRILGAFVLLVLLFGAFIAWAPAPTYSSVEVPDLIVEVSPERVERGLKLVANNCQNCHHGEGTDDLRGRLFEDEAANQDFGLIYASNITQLPAASISKYTDGELYRLLRTGVKRNGELAVAVMPRWPLASEQDIADIIAFLRSDHRLVAPAGEIHPPHQPSLLERALLRFVIRPTPYQQAYPPNPSLADPLAYGAYHVNNINLCFHCHSESLQLINEVEPRATPGYLQGGIVFQLKEYEVPTPGLLPSANPDLAAWSEEEFITAVKYGIRPNKPAYRPPMHPFSLLDSSEVRAIYAYLQAAD